jgi:hypothetical protein
MFNSKYQIVSGNSILAEGKKKADCIEQLENTTFPTIIKIENKNNTQVITVFNKIWLDTKKELPTTYSNEFTRREILTDIAEKVCKMNGYKLNKITY